MLGLVTVTPAIGVAWMSPVVKGPGFHRYADGRDLLGIPHAGDVLSNLIFVIVGVAGLVAARRVTAAPRALVMLFFASIVGIGLGSGAYHAAPGDATLALDWLPIVVSLAFLVALVVGDRVDRRLGAAAAVVLPLLAAGSVLWWWLGGGTGGGDMRWYAALQLSLVALVPVIVLLYPQGALDRTSLLLGVACFVAARALHSSDARILDLTGVSGHTMKHLVAGVAAWFVLRAVHRARAVRATVVDDAAPRLAA